MTNSALMSRRALLAAAALGLLAAAPDWANPWVSRSSP